MPLNNKTYSILCGIAEHLKDHINEMVEAWNESHPSEPLPTISETDIGFRDVVSGLRSYPALCIAESGRDSSQAYFTTFDLNICIAVRNDDIDELQRIGYGLADCLEDAFREDCRLGDLVTDSSMGHPETGVVSGVFIFAVPANIVVDLGSFGGM
ncbi:MAG: hypothetical protein IJS84_09250 [Spirochaetales bacterium]|nr:hypothetical protein [Spirochaetales bacterium]MBQ7645196.1 hypothetical protein [Spirochaetales bacterium]